MPRNRYVSLALAVLIVAAVSIPAGAAATTGDPPVYPVGDDHPLADNSSIQTFAESGVVRGNLTTLNVGLTIAEEHNQANISGYYTDVTKVYACVDYRESIPRTLKLRIPGEYMAPRPGTTTSLTSDHTAHYRPTRNDSATVLTVTFRGQARACFAFGLLSGRILDTKSDLKTWVNNTTGIKLPSFGGTESDWRHVPTTAFLNDTTHAVPTKGHEVTMQFDSNAGPTTSWIAVPECDNPSQQAICRYREVASNTMNTTNDTASGNTSIVLMSTQERPPPVRYKYGDDASAGVDSALADIQHAVDEFLADVGDLFGGGG